MSRVTIDTKTFASLIGVSERELIFAINTNDLVNGKKLPLPAKGYEGKTRRYLLSDAMKFIK